MHASTIEEHDRLTSEASDLVATWRGTDPMRTADEVRGALRVSGAEYVRGCDFDAMLPYVVDACREAGLLITTKAPWRDVPLYWLDSARPLTDDERVRALREYRTTGGMHLVVMAEPTGSDSPEECERLSETGPRSEEIDWTGFDAAK